MIKKRVLKLESLLKDTYKPSTEEIQRANTCRRNVLWNMMCEWSRIKELVQLISKVKCSRKDDIDKDPEYIRLHNELDDLIKKYFAQKELSEDEIKALGGDFYHET